MYWVDSYADKYQKINGFEANINTFEGEKKAWISMKPTTRAAYDLSMRENTIDGLITMDNIECLKSGYTYYLKEDPNNLYFIQTLSKWETQPKSKNFNAIRCNCKVTIQRKGFKEDNPEEQWIDIYKDVPASFSNTLSDSKNFNAGFEVTTIKIIQLPMWEFIEEEDENGEIKRIEKARVIKENDKVIVTNDLSEDLKCEIHVESVDNFGISGTVKLQGTQDMRIE